MENSDYCSSFLLLFSFILAIYAAEIYPAFSGFDPQNSQLQISQRNSTVISSTTFSFEVRY